MSKLSIKTTLLASIALLSLTLVAFLARGAWTAWGTAEDTAEIVAAAEATQDMFAALHNLRVERPNVLRALKSETAQTGAPNTTNRKAEIGRDHV